MPTSFIRLSTLIILLFYNGAIFGMISSNTAPLNFFSQGTDFIKIKIFPLLLGNNRLNLRATCTTLVNDQEFYRIYNQFNNEKKQIASSCAFLHCIKEKKYEEVKWFLKNEIHNPLFNIHYPYNCIEYFVINPLRLIEAKDLKMKKLFADYHYDEEKFVESLKKNQKKYREPAKLNEKLQSWQRTSHHKKKFIEGFDPISNTYKKTITVKEFTVIKLFPLIRTNCYSKSILAACIGDINCFKEAMKDMTGWDFMSIHCTILLSIFAAFKNKDLNLIKFILTQLPFYSPDEHRKNDITELLSYFLLNTPVEYSTDLKISKDICFEDRHIQWIKQLIQEGIFTAIPKMIENNKDNNKQIKEVYKTLVSSIYESFDKETTDQREKAKIDNKACLIQ